MPEVRIRYRRHALTKPARSILKSAIHTEAALAFEVEPHKFSLDLRKLSKDSEPTHDIAVRFVMDSRRHTNIVEPKLAAALAQALRGRVKPGTTVGVSVLYGNIEFTEVVVEEAS